jgi:hypothetical protein
MQLVTAKGTAINTTIAALAAVTGDTLTVPIFPDAKKAWILQVWADVQLAGTLRIRSPKGHDNVNGLRIDTVASDAVPLLPWGFPMRIYPGDALSVELAGSSTGGDEDFVSMLQAYEELPGQSGRYLSPDDVQKRMLYLVSTENTITTGTNGQWGGAEAINAEIDQFQADFEYAILGYKVDTECQATGYRSPNWANTRIGGPGVETEPWLTSDWFARISRAYNMPLIPYFAGSDKASVLVDCLIDENGADPTFTTYLAAMRRGS